MKKIMTFVFGCAVLVAASSIYVNAKSLDNNVIPTTTNVNTTGCFDGHCIHCGSQRCPVFRAVSGAHPTTCVCGHPKVSHVNRY